MALSLPNATGSNVPSFASEAFIRFDGCWQRASKQPLTDAIHAYEAHYGEPTGHGSNWVAVAIRLQDRMLFIVSRHGWKDVLRGDSPGEIAHRIRNLTRGCMRR
ncbi:hypothetical protein [Longibacter sp.]|uniref:hypothetical protein n=1 Tax=Longibacter sp. TaxID=2045415 RepID=UPI003EBF9CF1